jgi:hypothetical protein
MKVTQKSPLTGKLNTMDLAVTEAQLAELASPGRRMIQDILPQLNDSEREFLMTGYTQEDWDKMFPPEEKED